MNTPTCKSCNFCKDDHCHRYPPTGSLYPIVLTEIDWCGEHRPRVIKL